MVAALVITAIFIVVFWLIFFQFKLIKLTIAWAVVSILFLVHLLLAFLAFVAAGESDLQNTSFHAP